jgi:multicomponent Na+:H+ antiporter subunit B
VSPGTVLSQTVARVLLAPLLMVAAALLVRGYSDVGDGFSAGAMAALGVLVQFVAFGREDVERRLPVRRAPVAAAAGLGLALAVAFAPLAVGESPLTHLPAPGEPELKLGSLELSTPFLLDVAIALLVFGVVVGIVAELARGSEEDG